MSQAKPEEGRQMMLSSAARIGVSEEAFRLTVLNHDLVAPEVIEQTGATTASDIWFAQIYSKLIFYFICLAV